MLPHWAAVLLCAEPRSSQNAVHSKQSGSTAPGCTPPGPHSTEGQSESQLLSCVLVTTHSTHTLPALVCPPMTSSLLSCNGVTDQPAAGGGPETLSSGLPSWPDGWAASASAGLGAVQASLLRLYIHRSAR